MRFARHCHQVLSVFSLGILYCLAAFGANHQEFCKDTGIQPKSLKRIYQFRNILVNSTDITNDLNGQKMSHICGKGLILGQISISCKMA